MSAANTPYFGHDEHGQPRRFKVRETGKVGTLVHYDGKDRIDLYTDRGHRGQRTHCSLLLMDSGEVRMYSWEAIEAVPTERD